jgi:hypothetical protein
MNADNDGMHIDPLDPVRIDLALLEHEERTISRKRMLLHGRIDHLYLSAPLDDAQATQLDELEEVERDLSLERRNLHRRIDRMRADIGLPPVEGRELDDVA